MLERSMDHNFISKVNIVPWVVLFIVLCAFFIRIYSLNAQPLIFDEMASTLAWVNRLSGSEITRGLHGVLDFFQFVIFDKQFEVIYLLFSLFISQFFLHPVFIARIPSVIIGTVTVFLSYLLGKKLYGIKEGVLSALFLAFLPWHIIMSRIGLSVMLVPFFCIITIYLLYRGISEGKHKSFYFSWVMLGLILFYVHPSGLVFLPIYLLSFFFINKKYRSMAREDIIIGILSFLIVITPFLVLMFRSSFFAEQFSRSYFSGKDFLDLQTYRYFLLHLISKIFTIAGLLFFPQRFPENLFIPDWHQPLLFSVWVSPLFLVSVILTIKKRTVPDIIFLVWFLCGIFFMPFLTGNIDARYLLVILPAPLVLLSRFLITPWGIFTKSIQKVAIFFVVTFIVGNYLFTWIDYFGNCFKCKDSLMINGCGSQEAAYYLVNKWHGMDEVAVVTDFRMVISPYLIYYMKMKSDNPRKVIDTAYFYDSNILDHASIEHHELHRKDLLIQRNNSAGSEIIMFSVMGFYELGIPSDSKEKLSAQEKSLLSRAKAIYYILWNPDMTKSRTAWEEDFANLYLAFKEIHPDSKPEKKIYYPDGRVAIEIFKVY